MTILSDLRLDCDCDAFLSVLRGVDRSDCKSVWRNCSGQYGVGAKVAVVSGATSRGEISQSTILSR